MKPKTDQKIIGQLIELLLQMHIRQVKSRYPFEMDSLLKSEKLTCVLEELANIDNPEWLNCLDSMRPSLKEDQRRLALFLYFGIAPKDIALIMQRSVNSIYTAKSRLKEYLLTSTSPHAKELLEDIGF